MYIALGIVLLLLIALFVVGLSAFHYVFLRRPVPNPMTPEGREKGHWEPYAEQIETAAKWLEKQAVKPLQVTSYDGKQLYGRFVERENAKGTIIFFHGYRSHFGVDFSASMKFYHSQGYNALYCDQRAHGLSEGRVITFGVKERMDVMSWVTYMSLMLGEDHPIFLSGLSMGASTVLMAADMEFPANVRGIIADCGFTSPGNQIRYILNRDYHLPVMATTAFLNIFTCLFGGFHLDEWSTELALENARYPVLIVHGMEDSLVPCAMSRHAFEACTSKAQLALFPEAEHGLSYLTDKPRYQKLLLDFLEEYQ